jgi:predicted CXXCH cytochrome family protein
MRSSLSMIGVVLIASLALSAAPSFAQDTAENQENVQCLTCHGEHGSIKKFSDGDFISTYVDAKALSESVHRSLRCTACHKDFIDQRHPERLFRSKLQFRIKESHGCLDCHAKETLKSSAIHAALFKKEGTGEPVVCTSCHSAHAVTHIAGGNVSKSEEKYCLGCHASEKHMTFKSGETLSVRVKSTELQNSSHSNVGCSDCHFGFSADDHPRRRFRSIRQYRLASSEICRRCHYDMYSKASEGVHYAMLSVGKLEAPTCIDCHGGHAISSLGGNRLEIVQRCKTCHSDIYDVYSRSVHGAALFKENNKDVPTCVDCHSSHSIKDASSSDFRETIPDTCSKCHSNETIMGKYGLSIDVVKTYLSDFHGVTLSLYQAERKEGQKRYQPDRPIAVCTDCHGTHGIASVSGAGVQALKRTLLKRCQTCHTNATENFPDAWLSHYKPSLTNAPLVFIVEQFYKIILPLMVIGLLFQIFLHIWRYLVNK